MARGRVTGGAKLRRFITNAKRAQAHAVRGVEVGFFASARYPDGTPVTNVAAFMNFGTKASKQHRAIPARPFFDNAIPEIRRVVHGVLRKGLNPRTMVVDRTLAGRIGEAAKGQVQLQITILRQPKLSPVTIERRRKRLVRPVKSTNPLVDTNVLRRSVNWRIMP